MSAYAVIGSLYIASVAASDLWKVDIDLSPAPSPQDGPPFSANASRDSALLPYQITGIVGSYASVILILGILMTTVGSRSRRRAQKLASGEKSRELVRPLVNTFDPSPISPQSQKSWYASRRLKGKRSAVGSVKSMASVVSPGAESVTSFDTGVVEADRRRRAEEMERLYAAVMLQDERKSQQELSPAPPEYSRMPLSLINTQQMSRLHDAPLRSPRSPIRAIYPPETPPPLPTSPIHPQWAQSDLSLDDLRHGHRRNASSSSQSQTTLSPNKRLRKTMKNITISAPLMRSHDDDNADGARTPLSPRIYTNPGIPPEPPTARTVDTFESAQRHVPTTPRSFTTWDEIVQKDETFDEVRAAPLPYPQRAAARPRASSNVNYSQPLPLEIDIGRAVNRSGPNSAASPNNTLPFRQLHWNSPSSPYYPYHNQGPFSAGPIKTTFVEARRDRLAIGTPRTGMATPYSAYMPFTPITPVAANLPSTAQRRQHEREAIARQGAITEEEQVISEKEMWDEAY